MKRVHAITIHHHGQEMLDACLRSLLAAPGVDLQVIVVANACDEPLPSVVTESPRVHVVRRERSLGFSAANNLGVEWARRNLGPADFYYFINNDTVSEPDSVRLLVQAIEEEPQAAVAGPRLLIQWAPDHLNSLGLNITEDGWGWDEGIGISLAAYGPLPARRRVLAATGSAIMVEAALYRQIGGWTELYDYYFEDVDLCLKAHAAGRAVVVEPAAVVYHQVSATMTLESERKLFLFWRNRLLLALVHWPLSRLPAVLHRVLVQEIWRERRYGRKLQRHALAGALRKLPRLLLARWRRPSRSTSWVALLRPAGSVPVITLPERPATPPPLEIGASASAVLEAVRALRSRPATGKRVLVLGWSPLPFENARMNYAPGARTWQLAQPLAADGHQVCVVCARMPGADDVNGEPAVSERDGAVLVSMDQEAFEGGRGLPELVTAFDPEVVIGVSPVPARRAAAVAGERPLVVDLFGDPMAEAQARAVTHPELEPRSAYRDLLAGLLERGDLFCAVSERQRWSAVGQLGLAGRLNRLTAGHELVLCVPCAVATGDPLPASRPDDLAADDLVVLWSGGFNTWCDVETLHAALEEAMAAEPRLRFVSTGAGIAGQDDGTYGRFVELVSSSPRRGRYLLKGCLPEQESRRYLEAAHLGVLTERTLYERQLGSSGRLMTWLAAGLPFVCTELSEVGQWAVESGVALAYPPGDTHRLAQQLLEALAAPDRLREMGRRGRELASQQWSAERTTEPLRRWLRAAAPAPDRALANPISFAGLARQQTAAARLGEVQSVLDAIQRSKMYRTWMWSIDLRRALSRSLRALLGRET